MSTDDGKRLAQLHDAMQDRIRELEELVRDAVFILEDYIPTIERKGASLNYGRSFVRHARYVLAKGNRR